MHQNLYHRFSSPQEISGPVLYGFRLISVYHGGTRRGRSRLKQVFELIASGLCSDYDEENLTKSGQSRPNPDLISPARR